MATAGGTPPHPDHGRPDGDGDGPGLAARTAGIMGETIQAFYADRCPQHAAAVAYRALFSLFPLAIVLVSVLGMVLRNDEIRQDAVEWIVDRLPVDEEGAADIEKALLAITTPASAAAVVTLVVFVWSASGMMTSLRFALDAALGTRARPMARGKAVDLLLVGGTGAFILIAFASNLVFRLLHGLSVGGPVVDGAARLTITFVSVAIAGFLLLRFVPAHRLRFRHAAAGALVTAVLAMLVSYGLDLFFQLSENWSVLYGSVANVAAFLYSIYLYAVSVLVGAEVSAALVKPPSETPAPPVRRQVRDAIVGLFHHVDPPAGDGRREAAADTEAESEAEAPGRQPPR